MKERFKKFGKTSLAGGLLAVLLTALALPPAAHRVAGAEYDPDASAGGTDNPLLPNWVCVEWCTEPTASISAANPGNMCFTNNMEVVVQAEVSSTPGQARFEDENNAAVPPVKCEPISLSLQVTWTASGTSNPAPSSGTGTEAKFTPQQCGTVIVDFHLNATSECEGCTPSPWTAYDDADTVEFILRSASLSIPDKIGVNDLVNNCVDPAGYPAGFVATALAFNDENEDDLKNVQWNVCPSNLGNISFTGDQRVRVLMAGEYGDGGGDPGVIENPSLSPSATEGTVKLEGILHSDAPGDAVVWLTYDGCKVSATTTVVRVSLDKFSYNRANPFPEVEITEVTGLAPGAEASVRYKILADMLNPEQDGLTDTFVVEEALGTYEYSTPVFHNRLGNAGHDSIRYTVYDNNGTKAIRWSHADPNHRAQATIPDLALMKVEIKDALAETPEEALGHLVPTPAFAGEVEITGERPSYIIEDIKIFARNPVTAYTNEVYAADIGNEKILHTLHGVARASAVVLEITGPRLVCVNDRFAIPDGDPDPGDDAEKDRDITDPDFIKLTLQGVPDCIVKGRVEWEVTAGTDRIRLVYVPEAEEPEPEDPQVDTLVSHDFETALPDTNLLSVFVEGRAASDSIDDVQITARILVDDDEENPLAFRDQTLEARFNLTVTDLRWTGWAEDNVGGRTAERTDLLVCDLDLRPAVKIEHPPSGAGFEQSGSLPISGSVRSMADIVTDIRVNGEVIPLSHIRFLSVPVENMTAESVRALTDRPPPYVVTFDHTIEEFSADVVLVEARNGVSEHPGFAVRRVEYADAQEGQPRIGTLSQRLIASPTYDLPEMVEFFESQSGWQFLYKIEVDHGGAGVGTIECRETCGAQPGAGLFRLRLPLLFVTEQGLNGAIAGPGLFVESDLAEPVEARYENGHAIGIRKLFTADLRVEAPTGYVPNAEKWWRGAALVVDGDPGNLTIINPFDQPGLPEDAEMTLEVECIEDQANPFAEFSTVSWSTMSGDVEIPLSPTGTVAGSAAFVLTLNSPRYGLLAKDRVRVSVLRVNLLIDTLNQYGFGTPTDSDEVEEAEDDPSKPGKIVLANDGDKDADGIPDFADGYDLFAEVSDDDLSSGVSFVPVVFEIPEPIDIAEAVVSLWYSASDPGAVIKNEIGSYLLPPGHLRLWARDGSDQRSPNPVWSIVEPGDYLPPTPPGGVPATEIGFSNSQRRQTFYLEGVRPSDSQGDQRIVFTVDPDGDGPLGSICTDAVRTTVLRVRLMADVNMDGIIDDADNLFKDGPDAAGLLLGVNNATNSAAGVMQVNRSDAIINETDVKGVDIRRIDLFLTPPLTDGELVLRIGDGENVRVFDDNDVAVLGPEGGTEHAIAASSVSASGLEYFVEALEGGREVRFELAYKLTASPEVISDTLKVSTVSMGVADGIRIASLHKLEARQWRLPDGANIGRWLAVTPIIGINNPAHIVFSFKDETTGSMLVSPETIRRLHNNELGIFDASGNPGFSLMQLEESALITGIYNLMVYWWNIWHDLLGEGAGPEPTRDGVFQSVLSLMGIPTAERETYWIMPAVTTAEAHVFQIKKNAITSNVIYAVTVNVFTIDVSWEAFGSALDENPNWGGGQRIFPCDQTPNDPLNRDRVRVTAQLTPPLEGVDIYFAMFDVDDPTPSDVDIDGVIDPNGDSGNDNRGDPERNQWQTDPLRWWENEGVTDSTGKARVLYRVTMQPGDNFRFAASLWPEDLSGLQVDDPGAEGHVAPGDAPVPGFAGGVSRMLTVWRKLHLEIDSMEAEPATGPEVNTFPAWALSYQPDVPQVGLSKLRIPWVDDLHGDKVDQFENGRLTVPEVGVFVVRNSVAEFNLLAGWLLVLTVEGYPGPSVFEPGCTLRDDDDLRLADIGLYPPLPQHGNSAAIVAGIAPTFRPAYIEIVDANAVGLNPNQTIPFQRNAMVAYGLFPGDFPECQDILASDCAEFWAFSMIIAYQPSTLMDCDPSDESPMYGAVVKRWPDYVPGVAAVYVELARENTIGLYSEANWAQEWVPPFARQAYLDTLLGAIAHELGHCPGGFSGESDHLEGGLMSTGQPNISRPLSSETIGRFRIANSWRD